MRDAEDVDEQVALLTPSRRFSAVIMDGAFGAEVCSVDVDGGMLVMLSGLSSMVSVKASGLVVVVSGLIATAVTVGGVIVASESTGHSEGCKGGE